MPTLCRARAQAARAVARWEGCEACAQCGAELPLTKLKRHREHDCPGRLVACRAPGCGKKVRADEMEMHRTGWCAPTRERNALAAKAAALDEPTTCGGCEWAGTLRSLATHEKLECPARLVPCKWPDCTALVAMNGMREHCDPITGACSSRARLAAASMVRKARDRGVVSAVPPQNEESLTSRVRMLEDSIAQAGVCRPPAGSG